jgi:hypothetical protein
VGDMVLVTFTYRWDAPATGGLPDDCPPDRCRWWRFEARPSGEVVLVENGGAEPPTPTPQADASKSQSSVSRSTKVALWD